MTKIQAGLNKVAVSLPSFYNETIEHGELKLHIDPQFNPTKHVKTKARICGLPLNLDEDFIPFLQALEKCDYLYFDFKALEEMDFVLSEKREKVYFVPIELVYAATIEDGINEPEIYPNSGVVLCEPFYGFGCEMIDMPDGSSLRARMHNGIIVKMNPKPDDRIATVRAIGPMRRNVPEQNISENNLVFRESFTNYEYEIAGTTLYVVNLENIDGVLEGTDFGYKAEDSVRNEYKYDVDATKLAGQSKDAVEWTAKEKKIY
jgi:hypothetical protein